MQEARIGSPSQEYPLEKGWQPTIPDWEIPWTEEPGGLQFMGVAKSRIQSCLNDFHLFIPSCLPWRSWYRCWRKDAGGRRRNQRSAFPELWDRCVDLGLTEGADRNALRVQPPWVALCRSKFLQRMKMKNFTLSPHNTCSFPPQQGWAGHWKPSGGVIGF